MKKQTFCHLLALLGVALTAIQTAAFAQSFYNTSFTTEGNAWIPQVPAPMTNSPGGTATPYNDDAGAVNKFLPHLVNPNILHIGTPNGGVWRTANAGASSLFACRDRNRKPQSPN